MPTTVQQDRLTLRFNHWDEDGDGSINKADFDKEAQEILTGFGASADTAQGHAVVSAFEGLWAHLAADAGVGGDGSMTFDQFAATVDTVMLSNGNEGFAALLRPCIQSIVGLVDKEGDGMVSFDEFKVWLAAIGVDESKAQDAFNQIDTAGGGELTVTELVNAVRDYHAGTLDVSLLG